MGSFLESPDGLVSFQEEGTAGHVAATPTSRPGVFLPGFASLNCQKRERGDYVSPHGVLRSQTLRSSRGRQHKQSVHVIGNQAKLVSRCLSGVFASSWGEVRLAADRWSARARPNVAELAVSAPSNTKSPLFSFLVTGSSGKPLPAAPALSFFRRFEFLHNTFLSEVFVFFYIG